MMLNDIGKILSLLALLALVPFLHGQEIDRNTKDSIDDGILWLLKAQNQDGSWSLDRGSPPDISCTALAALALMAQGELHGRAKDTLIEQAIAKATQYVAANWNVPQRNTVLQGKLGPQVDLYLVAIYTSQIYGMTPMKDYREARRISKVLHYTSQAIAAAQDEDGSWSKDLPGSLAGTGMAWLALRCTHSTGIAIESACVDKTIAFIKNQSHRHHGLFTYRGGYITYQHIYATTASLRILYGMGEGRCREAMLATNALLEHLINGRESGVGRRFLSIEGEDYLAAMFLTQALLHERGHYWSIWYPWLCKALQKKQNYDGSWSATGCISGKTVPTACALLALQAPLFVLPMQEL